MSTRCVACVAAVALAAVMAGCEGKRVTGLEYATDEGQWRVDGILIRSYNVTLPQAYDSILKLAQKKKWIVVTAESGTHTADIDIRTVERVEVEFEVWSPPNRATEIGVEYNGGDKIGSTGVLSDLERYLPGKRITVNPPN